MPTSLCNVELFSSIFHWEMAYALLVALQGSNPSAIACVGSAQICAAKLPETITVGDNGASACGVRPN